MSSRERASVDGESPGGFLDDEHGRCMHNNQSSLTVLSAYVPLGEAVKLSHGIVSVSLVPDDHGLVAVGLDGYVRATFLVDPGVQRQTAPMNPEIW